METRLTVLGAVLVFLFSTADLFSSGTDEETQRAALLLGYNSLDLFYGLENCDNMECRSDYDNVKTRLEITEFVRTLDLTVSYPENPMDATIFRYGQEVLDELDSARGAAFIVGWYGRIEEENLSVAESVRSSARAAICDNAERAKFDVDSKVSCSENPAAYFSEVLKSFRN